MITEPKISGARVPCSRLREHVSAPTKEVPRQYRRLLKGLKAKLAEEMGNSVAGFKLPG